MRTALLLLTLLLIGCTAGQSPTVSHPADLRTRLIIDTREPAEFAAGHAPGALNLQLGWNQLAERIHAYVPDASTPLAVRSKDESQARLAISLLQGSGYDDVVPFSPAGETEILGLCRAEELKADLNSEAPPIVIDVRSQAEYATGTIESALLFEQDEAPGRLEGLDPKARYVIICEGGWRSSQLASLMHREGFSSVTNVIDGMAGWRALEE